VAAGTPTTPAVAAAAMTKGATNKIGICAVDDAVDLARGFLFSSFEHAGGARLAAALPEAADRADGCLLRARCAYALGVARERRLAFIFP